MSAFYHGTARLPNGWIMRRVRIDDRGYDVHGWFWGPGHQVYRVEPESVDDSLTVRAPSPVVAIALLVADGWPPRKSKRYNWEYADAVGR